MWLPVMTGGRLLLRPGRRMNTLPIWSTVMLRPASRAQPTTRSRPWRSSSVRARRHTPPLSVPPMRARVIRLSQRRSPLMRRASVWGGRSFGFMGGTPWGLRTCSMSRTGRVEAQSGCVCGPDAPHGPVPMQAVGALNRPISLQPFGQWPFRVVCGVAALVDSRAIDRAPRLASHPEKTAARPVGDVEHVLTGHCGGFGQGGLAAQGVKSGAEGRALQVAAAAALDAQIALHIDQATLADGVAGHD